MSGYRIEIAVSKKGTRYSGPRYRLTHAHIVAAAEAIYVGVGHRTPFKMTPQDKRLARWVGQYLLRARSDQRAFDWLAADKERREQRAAKRRRKARKP